MGRGIHHLPSAAADRSVDRGSIVGQSYSETAGFREVRLLIVTGLSGSGKGTVLRALEDAGFYTVDNLPVDLIRQFVRSRLLSKASRRAALVVDIREGELLTRLPRIVRDMKARIPTALVYLEASDGVLQRRFSETRRPHPAGQPSVAQSIAVERALLRKVRELADLELDTSRFNIHDLRRKVLSVFQEPAEKAPLRVTVGSFGFKYGPPSDADVMLDVRFLPNPNYEPNCRHLTGRHEPVIAFLESYDETRQFLDRAMGLLDFVLPRYAEEGKSYLSIYLGCTGGRHRSVYIAESMAASLRESGLETRVQHRDIDKEV